ncbi:MAG: tyrosine phosphatase family protein [Alphaproteobacteria bacterium]
MPSIHVCALAHVASTVETSGATHLVTLLHDGSKLKRPQSISADRHLFLGVADIIAPIRGMTEPSENHVRRLISFVDNWDGAHPMVIHCFAGISRSTAGAFIALCHLAPEKDEMELAQRIRQSSKVASPNTRLVELADGVLDRKGRMVEAIRSIGNGTLAFRTKPFELSIGDGS